MSLRAVGIANHLLANVQPQPVSALAFDDGRGPSVDREIRIVIRQMNAANQLWDAHRIRGELLKCDIEIGSS
jgi:hypothetical protein